MSDYVTKLIKRGDGNFFTAYRPLRFDELLGPAAGVAKTYINDLDRYGRLSNQSILFVGDSGSGKTTLAYILGLALNCKNLQKSKLGPKVEPCLECSSCRAALNGGMRNTQSSPLLLWNSPTINKDQISDIVRNNILGGKPLTGQAAVNIFDEAHKLTKEQKSVLLTPLEALPKYSYVVFTTNMAAELTDKQDKQTKAVLSRFTKSVIEPWSTADLIQMITDVVFTEHRDFAAPLLTRKAIQEVALLSEGNARTAMNILQQLLTAYTYEKSITPDLVTKLFPDPESAEDFDGFDIRPLFKTFFNKNLAAAVAVIDEAEQARIPATEIAYKINRFLKNQIYKAGQSGDKEAMKLNARRLHLFTNKAINDSGEPYARLLVGVIAALA